MTGRNSEVLESLFVLPRDVLIVPVLSLAEDTRAHFDYAVDDYAVARPRSRRPSSIVDPATAALLEEFRTPSRLVDAIVRFSRHRRIDPAATLEGAFDALRNFCNSKILVTEGADDQDGIEASFTPGQLVAGCEILRLVRVLDDSELYQARDVAAGVMVALKIERPSPTSAAPGPLAREAAILWHLAGRGAPRLVRKGVEGTRPYLAAEWRSGSSVTAFADELRAARAPGWRRELAALCRGLLAAYEDLHGRGVVHGDVHPGNLLVDIDGSISIIDFGMSRLFDRGRLLIDAPRAGVGQFYDRETAAALFAGRLPPPATTASDRYALAVLIDRLITGRFYLDFRSEQEELLRQVATGQPLSFAARGIEPCPELEAVLGRALGEDARTRCVPIGEFHRALESFADTVHLGGAGGGARGPAIDRVAPALARYGLDSELLRQGPPAAPSASLWTGGAGIAYFLYRLAVIRGAASALALADAWASRTELLFARDEGAFTSRERRITPEIVGRSSPFHTLSGVHAVAAGIAAAGGHLGPCREEILKFVASSSEACGELDLTLGRAGTVLAAATLFEMAAGLAVPDLEPLRSFLVDRAGDLGHEIGKYGDITRCPRVPHLGMAHGWAGLLYAWLRAEQTLQGEDGLGDVAEPLEQLAALARPLGRGLVWPGTLSLPPLDPPEGETLSPSPTLPDVGNGARTPDNAPGWCSGSAGHVHLWLLAHELYGEERFLATAERAAWAAWEHPDRAPSLCCGLGGRAVALLRMHRYTGEPAWLSRARSLFARAPDFPDTPVHPPWGLFKGPLGLALLQVELECPEHARMPLFEA